MVQLLQTGNKPAAPTSGTTIQGANAMNERDKKCEERIDDELARIIANVKARNEAEDRDEYDSEHGDPLEALGITKEVVITYLMSWGGPSDEFEIHIDPTDRSITEIFYVYKDWFDGARRRLEGEEFDLIEAELSYLAEDY
jgi:hypothetical protein